MATSIRRAANPPRSIFTLTSVTPDLLCATLKNIKRVDVFLHDGRLHLVEELVDLLLPTQKSRARAQKS